MTDENVLHDATRVNRTRCETHVIWQWLKRKWWFTMQWNWKLQTDSDAECFWRKALSSHWKELKSLLHHSEHLKYIVMFSNSFSFSRALSLFLSRKNASLGKNKQKSQQEENNSRICAPVIACMLWLAIAFGCIALKQGHKCVNGRFFIDLWFNKKSNGKLI